jgi:2-dehydropantoate 2-reductase
MRWKYGKLLMNLNNALDAVLDKQAVGAAELAAEISRSCQDEGNAVLTAAGIAYNTDEERRAVQGDRMQLQAIEGVGRGGGSTWQSLARGAGSVEADYLNGEIALLGRLHGVPTPVNDLLQRLVAEFARQNRGPGGLSPDRLRDLLA